MPRECNGTAVLLEADHMCGKGMCPRRPVVSGLELGGRQSQGRDVLPTRLLAQESEHLRSAAFAIYAAVLAKVRRRSLVFPLKHQVLNLLILLALHLAGTVGTQHLVVLLLLLGFG